MQKFSLVTRYRLPLTLALLMFSACAAADPDEAVEDGDSTASRTCYVEVKVGHWCDDGEVDAGVWEVACFEVTEDRCNATEFPSGIEFFGGCEWETKQERHEWISAAECSERASEGLLLPDGAECAYHQDCESGCCGEPGAYVCVPCGE